MGFSNYEIIYLITGLFSTYVLHRFFRLFFEERISSQKTEIISFFTYYVFNAAIHFYINIPLVLLVMNITGFLLLTFNYKGTLREKILGSIYIFLFLAGIEIIVISAMGIIGLSMFEYNDYRDSGGIILTRIVSYLFVLLLENFKNVKKGHKVGIVKWVTTLMIPLVSLYLIFVIYQASGLSSINVTISISSLFLINILSFYLYDSIQLQGEQEMERKLLIQQNEYYSNQFKLMQFSEETFRAFKHDLRNHLGVLEGFAGLGEVSLRRVDTGNITLDSILNFKIQEAIQKEIKMETNISVPEEFNIPAYDLTIIFGNILDNAIEATDKYGKEKRIKLSVKYNKGRMFIELVNPCIERFNLGVEFPETSKKDKTSHGIGLPQVRKTVEKYNGDMEISADGEKCQVFIMLFIG